MNLLLDTNIILHRESKEPSNKEIGKLFNWIDRLDYKKTVHQVTIDEISKIKNVSVRKAFLIKLDSYHHLPTTAPLGSEVKKISDKYDICDSDRNDTLLLNEVFSRRVDYLLTEDRKIHQKAKELGIDDKVFTIDTFLEKVTLENPDFKDYKILSVKKEYFGNIDLNDEFFDSLKEDYIGFEEWFNKKAQEFAYVCHSDDKIIAFLYLKIENEDELYPDLTPEFSRKKRLKIGTFKVQLNGIKLGERFLKIVFDNAMLFSVGEIYVTIFTKRLEQERLINLLNDFGFQKYGIKESRSGKEDVYTRDFSRVVSGTFPKKTYPFISRRARKFLVPIYPEYHTNLLPDSILRNESPLDYIENMPFRNAISKVYISRSINRDLKSGDIIIFYRTGGIHRSVVTTLGIIESIHTDITDLDHFISLCRKRSVFTDQELKNQWESSKSLKPFVVNFLYTYSFPRRLNLAQLIHLGIIRDSASAPRGFEQISNNNFDKIISETGTDGSIIVD
jgi:hypothetical protein